jgi:hypothetical protein
MSTWLTAIVINSARMKLRRRLLQARIALDEPFGKQNLSLADIVSDTRPDLRRYIASDKSRKDSIMRLCVSRPLCGQPFNCAPSKA